MLTSGDFYYVAGAGYRVEIFGEAASILHTLPLPLTALNELGVSLTVRQRRMLALIRRNSSLSGIVMTTAESRHS
ncbi:MAG: hypothetical protein AB7G47_15685 [Mycolicibacterium sp.]|uniref:hypothetical protein n=1 Tax=Mycolicibacterium sp. TaxID=2320850 RepID=UPI003D0A5D50